MATTHPEVDTRFIAEVDAIAQLIPCLQKRGYEVIGPTLRDGAIVYDTLEKLEDLPAGWTDEQGPGHYRVKKREDGALFGYALGPGTWKKFLHPPEVRLFRVENDGNGFRIVESAATDKPPRFAIFGARACELAAIAMQDRILLGDKYVDNIYGNRRREAFIVAVQCTQPSSSCFCTSMGTGPQVKSGYDLVLTEVNDNGHAYFVVAAGTPGGADVLQEIEVKKAPAEAVKKAAKAVDVAAAAITRQLDVTGVRELLYEHFEDSRWEDVAKRCMSCANCTMVCPTCFCITVDDSSDLGGEGATRYRRWDSCFTMGFTYIHGGNVRLSPKSRYRQWLTHKFASWQDQFGSSGCVGCGRCITWCPAGIDITEEVAAIRADGRTAAGEGE